MPNGTLKLYNKQTNALLVTLDILGTFNIEDNLNETPSNMKVKVITTDTYREEFEVNTVAYHEDTNTWWVIKSDESTYLMTGEYEHEIQLVEYLEFYAYRHLPNCAFAPNTYDLEDMLNRLFDIAKISVTVTYPSFLDKDKIMPFMSFENYTVANAIKHIARAINAIPKMSVSLSPYQPQLTFINRNGLDTAIVETLNTQFPVAYEKNINSTDQFMTRAVSNVTNAKSSISIVSPTKLGYKILTPNSGEYNTNDVRVFLPTKIESVDFIRVYLPINIWFAETVSQLIFSGYYLDKSSISSKIMGATGTGFTSAEKATAVANLPEPLEFYKVELNGTINKNYNSSTENYRASIFKNKMKIVSKFDYDQIDDTDEKDRTAYYVPYSNEIVLPLSLRNGLEDSGTRNGTQGDHNPYYQLFDDPNSTDEIYMRVNYTQDASTPDIVKPNDIFVQVVYKPVADIKITIDNDNDAQDEKFFNQSGKVIDAVSVSKLITSHTNDSVDGTKIRNARYTSLASILPLGQLVSDTNQLYVITQRSIDAQIKNGNEYYNVLYTLSRNRIARSENIVADSSVISYKTPDDNLVFRTQLYKDYIELSLNNITPKDTPYLSMDKALVLSSTLAGTNFDYTVLASNDYGTTPTQIRYVKSGSVFDLHKAKLINVNWQDNNIVGTRLENITSTTYAQTPIVYTDNLGKATNFDVLFLNTSELENAVDDYNTPYNVSTYDPLIPFSDITNVPSSFYSNDVVGDGRFSIRIQEANYKKDPFEIPVFEYMIQANDDFNQLGNVVVGNDLFTTLDGEIRYHYIINNTTRFTAENADRLRGLSAWTGVNDRRVTITRTSATQMDLDLFSVFNTSTRNTSAITNVGFYAVKSGTGETKFLFGINDYTMGDNDDITIYINNWKI